MSIDESEIYMINNNDFITQLRIHNIQKELCDEDRLFIKRSHQHFRTSVYFRQYKRCV